MSDVTDVLIRYNQLKRKAAEIADADRGKWLTSELSKFTDSELVEIVKHITLAHESAML